MKCQALLNQKQHIEVAINRQSDQVKQEYRTQLTVVIDCARFLLRQDLCFRGHRESELSLKLENFCELVKFVVTHNESLSKVFKTAPGNMKLVAPEIQKDISSALARETTRAIIDELGGDFFTVLIDESRDISVKEQMVVVLCFVDKKGRVVERFLSLVHISTITALSLKTTLEFLFAKHGLSLSRIRGQGYDGASNMQGEFNGLKSLILKENGCAFYVHCFAHQLQLALVAVAKKHVEIALLFTLVTNLSNMVGGSCKRRDALREKQVSMILEE